MATETRATRFQQRLACLLTLAAIMVLGYKLYRQHDHAHIRYDPRQEISWIVPNASEPDQRNRIISNARWRINYSDIERILWEAQDRGSISPARLSLLERVHRLLPNDLTTQELIRLESLVKKSMQANIGKALADLIVKHYSYSHFDQKQRQEINQAGGQRSAILIGRYLDNLKTSQQSYFGAYATDLFEHRNAQTIYFYQRRLIRLDKSLNESQKKSALEDSKREYQAAISSSKASEYDDH